MYMVTIEPNSKNVEIKTYLISFHVEHREDAFTMYRNYKNLCYMGLLRNVSIWELGKTGDLRGRIIDHRSEEGIDD